MTLYLAFRLDYDHTLTLKRKTKDSLSKLPLDPIGKKEVEICGRLHNIFDTATPLVEEGGVGGEAGVFVSGLRHPLRKLCETAAYAMQGFVCFRRLRALLHVCLRVGYGGGMN